MNDGAWDPGSSNRTRELMLLARFAHPLRSTLSPLHLTTTLIASLALDLTYSGGLVTLSLFIL